MGQREIYDLLKNGAELSENNVADIYKTSTQNASKLLNKIAKLPNIKKKRKIIHKDNVKLHSRSKYEVTVYYYET